ncbi:MAG: hypothetical protein ABIZ04_00750 [Opitutus sp.]
MKTAIFSALVMFSIAALISFAVAGLMRVLFIIIRRLNPPRSP